MYEEVLDGAALLEHSSPRGERKLAPEEAKAITAAVSRALRRAARESRRPPPIVAGGGGRARRGDRAFRLGLVLSLVLMVALPVVGAGIYWGGIASDQYASEVKFTLRVAESTPLDGLGGLAGLAGTRQQQEALILANYIESSSAVQDLSSRIDFPRTYGHASIDYFSRLEEGATIEKATTYWRRRVNVKVDAPSGIVTVNVRAFSPEESVAVANQIVALSEKLVNALADRPRQDAYAAAKRELELAAADLKRATRQMRDARNVEGVLDAGAAADAINKVVTSLRLQLAETESALDALGPAGQASPQVKVQKSRAEALRKQIQAYSQQIAGRGDQGSLADSVGALSAAQTDLDVARRRYADAAAAYEATRIDLETRRAYVVAFVKPSLAQESTYPRRWLEWLIIVLPGLLAWSIGVGIAFQARDNMAK